MAGRRRRRGPQLTWRQKLDAWLESSLVQNGIIALIVLNAALFGLETFDGVVAVAGPVLHVLDNAILAIFVLELTLKFVARGFRALKDPWTVFDAIVIGLALMPATGSLSALRALRVLRVLRLVSAVPSMRRVVESLLRAIPGIGSVAALMLIIMYVAAVIGTRLFGDTHPQFFGGLGISFLTLFQILTVEGWPDIQRSVMEDHPYAWLFFVPFLIISTFAILNLFVGVIVDSMQSDVTAGTEEAVEDALDHSVLAQDVAALRGEIAGLRRELAGRGG